MRWISSASRSASGSLNSRSTTKCDRSAKSRISGTASSKHKVAYRSLVMQFRCVSNWIGMSSFSDISIHLRITGIIPSTDSGITCPMTSTKGAPKSFAINKVSCNESMVLGKATISGVSPQRSMWGRIACACSTSPAPRSMAMPS